MSESGESVTTIPRAAEKTAKIRMRLNGETRTSTLRLTKRC